MGCYGIGISRTLQALIEHSHDSDGIIWPWTIAPFQVLVCLLDPQDKNAAEIAGRIAAAAEKAGADVLVDDRAERPGVNGGRARDQGGGRRNEVARRPGNRQDTAQ